MTRVARAPYTGGNRAEGLLPKVTDRHGRPVSGQMPGLVEAIYDLNPGLADLGQTLPVGTSFDMPIPIPREQQVLDPIRLW